MDEKSFLINSFKQNFLYKNMENVAIYGISPNTKIVLDAFPDFELCGLMDGFLKSGEMYGKKMLSDDDVDRLNVKNIIIIARAASVKIVYNRIRDFCQERNIHVYDINGTNLAEKYHKRVVASQSNSIKYEELIVQIDRHDVISFDIFDTILMRQILEPTDLFRIIDDSMDIEELKGSIFSVERIKAEHELLTGKYPDIDAIYDRLQSNLQLEQQTAEYLKNLELQLEYRVSIARDKVKEAYLYALAQGKDIYFVSDMYLKKEHLAALLEKQNIKGYKDIFVSSEYGCMKTGGLFTVLQEKIGKKSCLHIGDNPEADISSAQKVGFDSFKIMSAREMMSDSTYSELELKADTLGKRNAIGMLIACIFNDPFALYNRKGLPEVCCDEVMAYAFVAPLITAYMKHLLKMAKEEAVAGVLFLARDGYLLEKLYRISIEGKEAEYPQGIYFLTSRFPCAVCNIYTEEDILHVLRMGYDGTPEQLLKERFLLDAGNIEKYEQNETLESYVLRHRDKIYETAKKMREAYTKYAASQGVKSTERYIFTDLAASGTCQNSLEKLLNIKGRGCYFVHIESQDSKSKSEIEALFEIDTWFQKKAFTCEAYVLLENIVTSNMPSVKSFVDDGVPVYGQELRTEEQILLLDKMQTAILNYYTFYSSITKKEWLDAEFADKLLGLMQPEKTDLRKTKVYNEQLADDFFNRSYSFGDILA